MIIKLHQYRPMVGVLLVLLLLMTSVPALKQYGALVLIARTTAAMDSRQFTVAAQSAEGAVHLDPRSGPAWFFLGQNLLALGQAQKSKQALDRAKTIFAHTPSTYRLLGQAHLQLSQWNESAEAFAFSLRLAPKPPAEPVVRRQMSLALYRAARFGESLHAQYLAQRGDKTAETELQAMRIHSAALSGLPLVAVSTVRSGLVAESPRQPSTEQLRELILLAGQHRRLPQVSSFLRLAFFETQMEPTRSGSALAAALAQQGQTEEALGIMTQALMRTQIQDPEPYLLRLQLMVGSAKPASELAPAVEDFAQKFPNHPELSVWKEQVRSQQPK